MQFTTIATVLTMQVRLISVIEQLDTVDSLMEQLDRAASIKLKIVID